MAVVTQVEVTLVPDPDTDAETADRLGVRLRRELGQHHGVDSVSARPGPPAPDSAKGDPATIGALIVAVTMPGGVLVSLIGLLNDWLARQRAAHSITVTIDGDTVELSRVTPEERRRLVDLFVARHLAGDHDAEDDAARDG